MGSAEYQDVQIEASWGVPESLYYNPCDRYTVNTFARDVNDISDDFSRFTLRTDSKGPKRHFVAPDVATGHFVRYEVPPPFDWKPTISEQNTLNMMAAYTRQLANIRKHPVNLMWFVDCRTVDGRQKAIPWYGEKLEELSAAAYRRNAKDTVVNISTEEELVALEKIRKSTFTTQNQGRVVVELNPAENIALRDARFAERVGKAAARLDGVVILNGATLSHIYYVLQGTGAEVCSRSTRTLEVDREFHRKLVRDKIPEVVRSSGEEVRIETLNKVERQAALRVKLLEEAFEAKDAVAGELLGELADVLEVVRALARASDLSIEEVERERKKKELKRGSFDDGIVLMETLSSSRGSDTSEDDSQNDLVPSGDVRGSSHHIQLDLIGHGWRDVRQGHDYWELIESVTVPLSHREWSIDSKGGYAPTVGEEGTRLSWELLGKRVGSNLKLKIRIKLGNRQLALDLPADFK
ncbi:MAG: hypothetical protein DRR42_23070 [Gammaproteobacteria bacterium]|nr:MAG: hypothetical protein DRR42_23070 [Gammaproteobacteria bacterium]